MHGTTWNHMRWHRTSWNQVEPQASGTCGHHGNERNHMDSMKLNEIEKDRMGHRRPNGTTSNHIGPNGTTWNQVGQLLTTSHQKEPKEVHGIEWDKMEPHWTNWMEPHGTILDRMDHMDPNDTIWVWMEPHGTKWDILGPLWWSYSVLSSSSRFHANLFGLMSSHSVSFNLIWTHASHLVLVLPFAHMRLHVVSFHPMGSHIFPFGSVNLIRSHSVSYVLFCSHMSYADPTLSHVIPLGVVHVDPFHLIWPDLILLHALFVCFELSRKGDHAVLCCSIWFLALQLGSIR